MNQRYWEWCILFEDVAGRNSSWCDENGITEMESIIENIITKINYVDGKNLGKVDPKKF